MARGLGRIGPLERREAASPLRGNPSSRSSGRGDVHELPAAHGRFGRDAAGGGTRPRALARQAVGSRRPHAPRDSPGPSPHRRRRAAEARRRGPHVSAGAVLPRRKADRLRRRSRNGRHPRIHPEHRKRPAEGDREGHVSRDRLPDGARVVAIGEDGLYVLRTDGGDPPRRVPGAPPGFPLCWSADGRAMYTHEETDKLTIYRVDLATGRGERLKELPLPTGRASCGTDPAPSGWVLPSRPTAVTTPTATSRTRTT